jgi:hypothetical protein
MCSLLRCCSAATTCAHVLYVTEWLPCLRMLYFRCCALQFGHYFWPSVVGIMPSLIIYVWLGSLAADVTEAVAGGGVSTPPAGEHRGAGGCCCCYYLSHVAVALTSCYCCNSNCRL